ncbi:MAG: histidinol dehydrogenase [Deltaproteobacteria bacterium]|nr:histidinol dehydrogenase [Deltaproteobacteria bacterium]
MPCRRLVHPGPDTGPNLISWLSSRHAPDPETESRVRAIISQVAEQGDDALVEFTQRFDAPDFRINQLMVPRQALAEACRRVPERDLVIISEAAENIRAFHQRQVRDSWMTTGADGTILGQLVRPVDRAGLYVPGGQGGATPLVSSLLMNAIPAQVAGVGRIFVCSPPTRDGSVNDHILATAHLLGLESVFAVGSAWAVAALAYGTGTIPAVDVIAGPGNIWVTTAKRFLVGRVGIDMIAGPSEIAILADAAADPSFLAADMLSQAEHDPLASSLLISPDQGLLDAASKELARQLGLLPRADIAKSSLKSWGGLIKVPDLESGLELVNTIAPEHFELVVDDPWPLLGKIRNAGAVFLGHFSPEPVGDYFAGPNHVLPTLRNARFSSALSVQTFCKETSLIATGPGYIRNHGDKIARLARLEGLEAHARSVEIRFQKGE